MKGKKVTVKFTCHFMMLRCHPKAYHPGNTALLGPLFLVRCSTQQNIYLDFFYKIFDFKIYLLFYFLIYFQKKKSITQGRSTSFNIIKISPDICKYHFRDAVITCRSNKVIYRSEYETGSKAIFSYKLTVKSFP